MISFEFYLFNLNFMFYLIYIFKDIFYTHYLHATYLVSYKLPTFL
jgi:hypothetical protein